VGSGPGWSWSSSLPWVARQWLAGAAALIAAAATAVIDLRRAPALTERDRVVLVNFDNRTGDAAFDIPLAQALVLDLEQSPFLKIVSDREIAATLQLMQVAADQPVTAARARDVCQRTAAKAVLEGSLVLLGSEYVIGLSAVNCWSGAAGLTRPWRRGVEATCSAIRFVTRSISSPA